MNQSNEIEQEIAEIKALKASAKRWKLGSIFVTLAVVIGCVWSIVDNARSLVQTGPRQVEMMAELNKAVQEDVIPEIRRQVDQSVKQIRPVVAEEIKKMQGRSDEISENFYHELRTLRDNVRGEAETIIQDTFGSELERREAMVRRMHPDMTREKIMESILEFYTQFEYRSLDMFEELFTPHLVSLDGILEHIATIKETEPEPDNEDIGFELAIMIMNIFNAEFSELAPNLHTTLPPHKLGETL